MRSRTIFMTLTLLAVGGVSLTAAAAQQDRQQQAGQAQGQASGTIKLVYEREVYSYPGDDRRDPFRPLTNANDIGPRFEALSLRGIIYSTGQGRSVALLADGQDRVYRVRVGDVLGNSRVIEIGPLRVVLAVENFGTTRQEILELPSRGGTNQ